MDKTKETSPSEEMTIMAGQFDRLADVWLLIGSSLESIE